jgi:hypothetical protein
MKENTHTYNLDGITFLISCPSKLIYVWEYVRTVPELLSFIFHHQMLG